MISNRSLVAFAFGMAIATAAQHSQAVTVTTSGDYFVGANPDFGIPSNTSDSQSVSNNSMASISLVAPVGHSVGGNAFADSNGVIGTDSRTTETVTSVHMEAKSLTNVTNNLGVAQQYNYGLNIPTASLDFYANYFGLGDSFQATNEISILLNGSQIWSTSATLLINGTIQFSTSGTSLNWQAGVNNSGNFGPTFVNNNGYEASISYGLAPYSSILDLGVWSSCSTFTLEYIMRTTLLTNASVACGYECFELSASIGDPSGVSGTPILGPITNGTNNNVPEPASFALLSLGLIGLIFVRRKRTSI